MHQPQMQLSKPSHSDRLGRYYTLPVVGKLLVTCMGDVTPTGLLDLGSGAGSLSAIASQRWLQASIVTVDVDTRAATRAKALLGSVAQGRHAHIHVDALNPHLPSIVRAQLDKIDAAVCNPPFIKPCWTKALEGILKDAGLSGSLPSSGSADAALLFLAQNLRTVEAGGTLGIILPDSMTSSMRYRSFREQLLERYTVRSVIKLPRNSFRGTDALASILILKLQPPAGNEQIPLYKMTTAGNLSPAAMVTPDHSAERMDYDFHSLRHAPAGSGHAQTTLAHICTDLCRGSIQNAVAKSKGWSVFHTTSLAAADFGRWVNLAEPMHTCTDTRAIHACRGDILIARVGRNLDNKICGVATGHAILSDCIYRLRVNPRYRQTVLSQLCSAWAHNWFQAHTYGVGARQLTKSDLLQFPINLQ